MSLPAISKHFKVLEDAALIARSRDAQWRPSLRCAARSREIVPQERIVCTDSFADEKGNRVPASHYGMGKELTGAGWNESFHKLAEALAKTRVFWWTYDTKGKVIKRGSRS